MATLAKGELHLDFSISPPWQTGTTHRVKLAAAHLNDPSLSSHHFRDSCYRLSCRWMHFDSTLLCQLGYLSHDESFPFKKVT